MSERRLGLVGVVFGVAATLLAARLVHLQLFDGRSLAERAARQRFYVEPVPARPGDIVDRHGRLLAVTISAPSLYAVPQRVANPRAFAAALATALAIDAERLAADLARNHDKHFLWIRRRLSEDEAAAIRRLELPRGSWGFRQEYLRCYPQGTVAAHLLGIRDIDNRGRGGIEQRYDALLRGTDGRRVAFRDARGRVVEVREDLSIAPTPGRTLVLTIDSVVQLYAERELDALMARHAPLGACALVMDVEKGELLAVASRPTFDPNDPANAPEDAWTNRAVTAVYEPGSTFKPLVVAWALDAGVLHPEEQVDCERGAYRMGRRVLHDHHGYGELSVTDILVKSSNIGMAKIGERLGTEGLHRCVTAFGFGRPTGAALPGERSGMVRPAHLWNQYSIGSVPMGHELAVTPLQLVAAHAALANGGRSISPRLVLRNLDPVLADHDASESSPQVASQVVSREAAQWVIGAMAEVVSRGTGRAAQLPGVTVFGKTGTAQKIDAETGRFVHNRHVVSFIGGAPAHHPRVVVLVMADEPSVGGQSGGAVAAPAAAEILRKTLLHLGVPPYEVPSGATRLLLGPDPAQASRG
jgi:cell division protein FtsI (penicillin-binding protein 3)